MIDREHASPHGLGAATAAPEQALSPQQPAWNTVASKIHRVAVSSVMPSSGTRIGQYELIRELGRGGMGTVYLARDIKLGRRVAIKFLHSHDPEITERFLIEGRATARCSHENIVVIHDVGEFEHTPFMVLEFLQGTPLTALLPPEQTMAPGRAVELMVPVVRALACAHQHGIVHRDLKPDNIFVTDAGTVKVLDFGVAKLLQDQIYGDIPLMTATSRPNANGDANAGANGANTANPDAIGNATTAPATAGSAVMARDGAGDHALTGHGAIIGTAPYMSPEQWRGADVDHRTDIWAVGIILYRMLVGRHPLAPRRGRELMVVGLLNEPMPRVRDACPDADRELAEIIDACLVKHKQRRLGSAAQLLESLESLLPGRHLGKLHRDASPYPGLRAFQETDAAHFFGRRREIAAAVQRLRDQPMLGVVGPSGVGKSSFIRAGIVPALKHSGEHWSALVIRPGRRPMAALAHALVPLMGHAGRAGSTASGRANSTGSGMGDSAIMNAPISGTGTGSDISLLNEVSKQELLHQRLMYEPGYLGTVLRSHARRRQQHLLLFVDQFEELYTLVADPAERRAFTACLASAADDATTPLRVVLSLRSDFIDRAAEDPYFMSELARSLFFLAPPNRQSLREAIVEPAQLVDFTFEFPQMVEHMLDHLEHTPGALPLLQFAARQLWELRDVKSKRLTDAAYRQIGGITGALASHADAVIAELTPQQRIVARALCLRLVTPEGTRAVVPISELDDLATGTVTRQDVDHLLRHLVQARLLVVQSSNGSNRDARGTQSDVIDSDSGDSDAAVELVHESLIHSWPRLRRWLDETQEDSAFLAQLRTAAKQWHGKGRPPGLLWRGEAVHEARRFQRRFRGQLPQIQHDFLQAVFTLANRARRRRRFAIIGVFTLLSLLVAATSVALVLIRRAQTQAVQQAVLAQQAEVQVRQQLTRVQAEEKARRTAEERERHAREEVEQANAEIAQSYDTLAERNEQLEQALDEADEAKRRADKSKRRARRDRDHAEFAAHEALRAQDAAQRANDELQRLLAQERERVKRFEEQSGTIIEDLAEEERPARRQASAEGLKERKQ